MILSTSDLLRFMRIIFPLMYEQLHKYISRTIYNIRIMSKSEQKAEFCDVYQLEQIENNSFINFKVVVIGMAGSGKTSLVSRYHSGKFHNQQYPTVGVDFVNKNVYVEGSWVKLQIWDTCGHDVYKTVTASFYRGACAAIIVYSISSRTSFEKAASWFQEFRQIGNEHAFVFLIATKADTERVVKTEEGYELFKKMDAAFFMETSAKTGQKVQQLFYQAAEVMYKYYCISANFRELANPRANNSSIFLDEPGVESFLEVGKKKKRCCP